MSTTVLFNFWLLLASLANAEGNWVSLEVTVPDELVDTGYFFGEVPMLFGSPPQVINASINVQGSLLAPWSTHCVFCPGTQSFEKGASKTIEDAHREWKNANTNFSGTYYNDTVSFGNVLTIPDQPFVLVDTLSLDYPFRMRNGHLGLYVDPSSPDNSVLGSAWKEGALINPVIGLRMDVLKPRLTIGALDPNDYEGTINWVQIEDSTDAYLNGIRIDGVKGFNGSMLPFGDNLVATINSLYIGIAVPPSNPYALDPGYIGPQDSLNLYPGGGFAIQCNETEPFVPFTVTVNGIDYRLDSHGNMLRNDTISATGFCDVALDNTTLAQEDVVLGAPFLRSVYMAYRFPTTDCPGYYGFAFPSGANRTQAEIEQKPRTTPTMSSQCLSFVTPVSTPRVVIPESSDVQSQTMFEVYGGGEKVELVGVNEIEQTAWSIADN